MKVKLMSTRLIYTIKIIAVFGCLLSLSQKASGDEIVAVPFVMDNGQIVVSAVYDRKMPLKMVLSNVYPSAIDIMIKGLQDSFPRGKRYEKGVSGSFTPSSIVPRIKVGDFLLPDLEMYWDVHPDLDKPSQKNDGVLGHNFFDNEVIKIDYPYRILSIYKGSSYKTLFMDGAQDDSKAIVKFKVAKESPPKERAFAITEEILIDGKKTKVLIDINERDSNGVRKIKIGTIEVENAPILHAKEKKYEYVLGAEFLEKFAVTFNYKDKKIMFEKKRNYSFSTISQAVSVFSNLLISKA